MAKFWIDTSVFLEASLGSLAFDLNPEFWDQIEADARAGIVRSPMFVYRELVDLSGRDDWVAQWAVRMKGEGILFEEPDALALASFTQIADYIHRFTDPSEGDAFLDEADPWVIAHAMAGGTIVVSQEKLVGPGSKRIKIPNICAHFSIGFLKTDQFLREVKEERG